jgi:putative transposon-encoded protein|tara:strand:- start:716 stop:988 length:273 start_codon:yes stop_codon:yes gene_type:complete
MSRKQPININIKGSIEVEPGGIYLSQVVPSGNGAVIKFYKRFVGKDVIVMVVDKMKSKKGKKEKLTKEDLLDLADYTEDAYLYSEKGKKD